MLCIATPFPSSCRTSSQTAPVPSSCRSPAATCNRAPVSPRSCGNSPAYRRSRSSHKSIVRRRTRCCLSGSTGLRQLVDVREADGWRELRTYLLSTRADDIQREALSQLAIDLSGVSRDCWRFFEALFLVPPRICTVRAFARRLDVLPSTLMSRFFRAQVPAPKQYLAIARLVRAARALRESGLFRRERRQSSRLFVATELRTTCPIAHARDGRAVSRSVRRRGHARPLSPRPRTPAHRKAARAPAASSDLDVKTVGLRHQRPQSAMRNPSRFVAKYLNGV